MLFNEPRRRQKKVSLTWYFNDEITITKSVEYEAAFTLATSNKNFTALKLSKGMERNTIQGIYKLLPAGYTQKVSLYASTSGWSKQEYRTITFEEEPTGDLLTFLQANATPQ